MTQADPRTIFTIKIKGSELLDLIMAACTNQPTCYRTQQSIKCNACQTREWAKHIWATQIIGEEQSL